MIFKWLSLVAGLVYIILGVAIIVYKYFFIILEPTVAYLLGIVILLYGILRIYRVLSKINNKGDE